MKCELTPYQAAELATLIYDIQKGPFTQDSVEFHAKDWQFDLNSSHSRIMGNSGTAFVVRKNTGFCSVAQGVGNFKNQLLILTRGTDNAFDWCTDGTAGYARSHSGFTVHSGFLETFKSILAQGLEAYFSNQKQQVLKVHCVGHSLGGALATLIAEWLCLQKKSAEVALYTFGSPRVGFGDYSLHVESLLGTRNIYRVYHQQDPVPWVPVWPFQHIPPISHYRLGGSGARIINPGAHSMAKSYRTIIGEIGKKSEWKDLEDKSWSPPTKRALKEWLNSDSAISFCSNTLSLLGAAIAWVFEVACEALSIAAQLFLSGGITALDLLAQILMDAMRTGKEEVSGLVKSLIKKINQFNGKPPLIDSQINKTTTMIAFKEMQDKLNREVRSALARAVDSEAA